MTSLLLHFSKAKREGAPETKARGCAATQFFFLAKVNEFGDSNFGRPSLDRQRTEQRKQMKQDKPKQESSLIRKTSPALLAERLPIFDPRFLTDEKQASPRLAPSAALDCRTNF